MMSSNRSCRTFLVTVALMLVAGTAVAEENRGEKAFATGFQDSGVAWGPCPEFMPDGCAIAVLQGDPAQANADIYFRLPAGATAPRHWHHSAERMVLVAGEMSMTYDHQDPVTLSVGDYAYGPPKLPHSASCSRAGECILFIAFEEPVDAIAAEEQ